MSSTITERQRVILTGAEIDGCVLVIPEKLSRPDYTAVNKVLTALGGTWDRKRKGHVFTSDPTEAVARVLETGEVPRPARTAEGFVATPPDVAEWLVRHFTDLGDRDQRAVLEPSAGDGALVTAIRDMDPYASVLALEPNQQRAACIPRDGTEVLQVRLEDYLHSQDAREFDAIVANPPFSVSGRPTIWIDHTWHCWRLLAPGGRLTSIAPYGLVFREDRKHREIRQLIKQHGGWHEMDDLSFEPSGTTVRTVVFWIDKPEDWTPEDDRTPKKRGKPTEEEKAQRRAEDQELRQAAIDALEDEEFVEDMGRRLAKMPPECRLRTYSARNQALVLTQADAMGVRVTGHLNTFRGWLDEGRVVRKGETAIRITAAMGDEPETTEDQQATEDGKEPRKRFRMTTRFDFSQTKGAEEE